MIESPEAESRRFLARASAEPLGLVVVVGAANTDIVGRSLSPLVERDSNPGTTRVSSGGVGRNIAENLARLGVGVELIAALGGDHNARGLAEECRRLGIGLAHAVAAPDLPGSLYLAVLDDTGEMSVALNDMRVLERLTVAELEARTEVFSAARVVVVDANLSAEVIEWIAENVEAPILLDPVSAAKAPRATGVLDRIAVLKCNAMEGAVLAGAVEPHDAAGIERTAAELRARGVATVFITAGRRGAYFATGSDSGWLAPAGVDVRNATGAGDAFSAGVAWGMLQGWSARRCGAAGSALAAMALASEYTVSDCVSAPNAFAAMKEMSL